MDQKFDEIERLYKRGGKTSGMVQRAIPWVSSGGIIYGYWQVATKKQK